MNKLEQFAKSIIRNVAVFSPIYSWLHFKKRRGIERKIIGLLKQFEQMTPREIAQYQDNLLKDFLTYANNNVPYYNKIFRDHNIDTQNLADLKRIPFLDKEIITNSKTDLLSKEYPVDVLVKKNTGGSTGKPLEFYCNTEAGLLDYAHHFYHYEHMGYNDGDIILGAGAVTISESERKNNIFWKNIGQKEAFGDIKLSILYLEERTIKYYVQKLLELKPAILKGYPSLFDELAQYIIERQIHLDFKIKGVSLTSEMCSEDQRKNIAKAFSCPIYFEYGHTEVSVLCLTFDNSFIYKSMPTYGYVEVLNDDGSETPIGEIGNIVTTGFNNRAMPFIRYKTEDLGKVKSRIGGIVEFESITGRSQDYIYSKSNRKISISALTSWQHLQAFARISKWQIIQDEVGVININIVKGPSYTNRDENEILEKISRIIDVDIFFKYVPKIDRTPGGKHLFLIQNLKDKVNPSL